MLVVSYRESRHANVACHCHPEYEYTESAVALCTALDDAAACAEFIVRRVIAGGTDHRYVHYVVTGEGGPYYRADDTAYEGAASVEVVGPDPDDLIAATIRALVSERLEAERLEEDRRRAEQERRQQAERRAAERRADLAELKRIQQRLSQEEEHS